jgi:hypothetical protein
MQPQDYFFSGAAGAAAGAAGAAAGAAPSAGFASAAGAAGAAGAAAGLASSFLPQADKATANIAAKRSDFFIDLFPLNLRRFTSITGNCCKTLSAYYGCNTTQIRS